MKLRSVIASVFFCLVVAVSSNAQTQHPAPPPLASGTPAMTQPAAPAKITNSRVVEMAKMGLDDDIIIARIKHSPCEFQLSDPDLLDLKKSGVSSKVVAAMLESAPAPGAASEPSDGKVRVFVTDSQSWETRGSGGGGGNKNGWGASSSFSGGARPQTAEI